MSTEQARMALGIANQKRRQIRNLKLGIEAGTMTFRELVLPRPLKTVETMPMVDVVRWMPGLQRGDVRQVKLGAAAILADINLLATVGDLSRENREWVSEFVMRPAMTSTERAQRSRELDRVGSDDAIELRLALDRCRALLRKAERDRDRERARADALESEVRGRQLSMPTVAAERMLAELADAVEEHKRGVSGSAPDFAHADQGLWVRKDEILMSDALREAA